jgi:hypothetical protein
MTPLKVDAPLAAIMAQAEDVPGQQIFDVSVRARGPLSVEEASELASMGVGAADTRRSIFPARVSLDTLRALAQKPWVLRVSLAQELRPLGAGGQP